MLLLKNNPLGVSQCFTEKYTIVEVNSLAPQSVNYTFALIDCTVSVLMADSTYSVTDAKQIFSLIVYHSTTLQSQMNFEGLNTRLRKSLFISAGRRRVVLLLSGAL